MALGLKIGEKIAGFFDRHMGKGLDIIKERVTDRDLATQLEHDFKTLIANNAHEAEMFAMQIENDIAQSDNHRIAEELRQNDNYTKRTRPMIARQSWWAGLAYIAANVVTSVADPYMAIQVIELNWSILVAIFSPSLTYMGVRSFDKWRNGAS